MQKKAHAETAFLERLQEELDSLMQAIKAVRNEANVSMKRIRVDSLETLDKEIVVVERLMKTLLVKRAQMDAVEKAIKIAKGEI